jgi:hypothetical protein
MLTAEEKKKVKIGLTPIKSANYDADVIATFTLAQIKTMVKAEELKIMKSARTGRFYLEAIVKGERALPNVYTAKRLDISKPMEALLLQRKSDGSTAIVLANKQGTMERPETVYTV